MRSSRKMTTVCIAPLREIAVGGRSSDCDRYLGPADLAQQTIKQPGPGLGIAECCRNAKYLQFRTAKRKCHSERVVDIVPDVGINNYFFRHRSRGRLRGLGLTKSRRTQQQHA